MDHQQRVVAVVVDAVALRLDPAALAVRVQRVGYVGHRCPTIGTLIIRALIVPFMGHFGKGREVPVVTVDEALDALLGSARTGDPRADLVAAAMEAMDRRERNTAHGGAVIAALRDAGMSWRDIETATGIPRTTAQRWAEPPERHGA